MCPRTMRADDCPVNDAEFIGKVRAINMQMWVAVIERVNHYSKISYARECGMVRQFIAYYALVFKT